jgi:hypothetical protein
LWVNGMHVFCKTFYELCYCDAHFVAPKRRCKRLRYVSTIWSPRN